MCQGGLGEAGASLGCLAETQGPGPALPGSTHPWVPPAWPAWAQTEHCSLPCTPPFRTAFRAPPLEQSLLWAPVL